jgi:hypothetical protein
VHRRTALQTLLLPLAGCWSGPSRTIANADRLDSVRDPEDTLDDGLRARGVADDSFFRTVLYTWTTTTQIASLRANHRLLVATASSGTFVSPFNRSLPVLGATSHAGSAIARLLATHPALIRRRYAWPSAFATVLGLGPFAYGSALIRIELRPDAWIGRFDPTADEPFQFIGADGAEIAQDRVLATPGRIGAIFHVRTEPGVPVPFREYVVTNPGMVASWSVATDEIRIELERERVLLRTLGERMAAVRDDATTPAHTAWARRPEVADTQTLWRATLAFDGVRYQPSPRRLSAIAAALDAYEPAGAPLVSKA